MDELDEEPGYTTRQLHDLKRQRGGQLRRRSRKITITWGQGGEERSESYVAHGDSLWVRDTGRPAPLSFPAGEGRGSWPAEQAAGRIRSEGGQAEVRMHLASDTFRVHVPAGRR